MKITIILFCVMVIVIDACKKNNDPNVITQQNCFVSNIYRDFDSTEIFYTNGKVIKKRFLDKDAYENERVVEYYYHGEQLDSTVLYSPTLNYQKKLIYTYTLNTLIKIHSISEDSTTFLLKYDSVNQISEQSFSSYYYGNHGEVGYSEYLFKFHFLNGNMVKCEEYFRGSPALEYQATDTITYTYDDKRNPFSLSIDPSVCYFPFGVKDFLYWNKNNIVREQHTDGYPSPFSYEYTYIYNSSDYPASVVEKYMNSWGNISTSTNIYTYQCK